jgi:hypothetical protein
VGAQELCSVVLIYTFLGAITHFLKFPTPHETRGI